MKRRSCDAGDNRRSTRSSATLKVGGVFAAGVRRSTRSSTVASTTSSRTINTSAKKRGWTLTPLTKNADRQSTSGGNASETSSEPTSRSTTRSLRKRDGKETAPPPVGRAAEEIVPPRAEKSAPVPRGPPPVGWVYEVVTSAQDLVPKKAFIVNKDLDDFKCMQENCNKSFRKERLLRSHLKHYHNVSIEAEDESARSQATTDPSSPNPEAATTSNESVKRRRRSKGRRNKAGAGKQSNVEENAVGAAAISSSSTDLSNSAVIETVEQPQSSQSQIERRAISPVAESQSPRTPNLFGTILKAEAAPFEGEIAQERSVQIPGSRSRGLNKRNTQRMAPAGSTLTGKRKRIPRNREEKPKKRREDENDRVDKAEDNSPARTRLSPGSLTSSPPEQVTENSVEIDVAHCSCGIEEEIGLMIQCGICLCWQHGCCLGFENEENVPEKYVCIACRNARRILQKQSHKQAAFRAMAEGRAPSLVSDTSNQRGRFRNLTNMAKTMADLRKALRGIEIRILRIQQNTDCPLTERRAQLNAATADAENIQRQMEICERLLANIDTPKENEDEEASTLRDTVKGALEGLRVARKLPLYRHLTAVKYNKTKRKRKPPKQKKDEQSFAPESDSQQA